MARGTENKEAAKMLMHSSIPQTWKRFLDGGDDSAHCSGELVLRELSQSSVLWGVCTGCKEPAEFCPQEVEAGVVPLREKGASWCKLSREQEQLGQIAEFDSASEVVGQRLWTRVWSDRARGNGFALAKGQG